MARNSEIANVNNVGAALFRGAVLALLTGSVLFLIVPHLIVRVLLHGQ